MGVTGLTKFIKKQPQFSSSRINLIDEVQKYRRENGDATIVFDFMGFINVFDGDIEESWLGGRSHLYLQRFEIFLEKLTKAGASLIFVCDGQLRSDRKDVWCKRRDGEYEPSLRIMKGFGNKSDYIRCKSVVKSFLKLIEEKNYGSVLISTVFDCDAVVAKNAHYHNALAIVASDSDFFIYEGSSQFWLTDNKFDTENMTVLSYDRNKVRSTLNLTVNQMKMLATIAGNDHSKSIHRYSRNHNDFWDIADFCRSLSSDLNDNLYHAIARRIKNRSIITEDDLQRVERAINSYVIDFELPEEPDAVTKLCTSNVLMYAFYMGGNFQYEVNFIDQSSAENNYNNNNNGQTFINSLLDVFKKLGGILLCDRREMALNIVTKYTGDTSYELRINEPIHPEAITEYAAFVFGPHEIYHTIRWNLLFWSLGLEDLTSTQLENIPKTHAVTALALCFLSKTGEISMKQADALLTMHYDIAAKEISLEDLKSLKCDRIPDDTVRTAQLFNRAITLIWDCLQVCALTDLISLDTFDGYYYASLLEKVRSQHFYEKCLERIRPYRLYTKYLNNE